MLLYILKIVNVVGDFLCFIHEWYEWYFQNLHHVMMLNYAHLHWNWETKNCN